MKWRDVAVAGLATTCQGRRLRLRQEPYDANSTAATGTAVVVSTSTLTVSTAYSSQQYSFAPSPVGPGTASSGYLTSPTAGPTAPPAYGPTGSSSLSQSTYYPSNATNATCSGATLNVLTASLDWWYTKTLYYAVSTFSIQFNRNDSSTGWTALPATTPFDVQSALAEPDCTSTPTSVASNNVTLFDLSCTPAASPVAAETTIITQTAYKEPPSPTGNGTLPKLIVTPEPASISVPDATQEPYTQGTPFVFFSQYEIVTKSATVFDNGSAGCAEVTQAYQMEEAFSFEYTGADVNGSLLVGEGVVGDVNPALLGLVGQETAVAGSWVAEPTVVLLMQEVFVAQAALAATVEPTASFLETPTPTRPPFVTLAPTGPDGPPPITYSPRVESSQTKLQLPSPGPGDDNRPTEAAEQTQGGNNGGGNAVTDGPQRFTSLVAFIAHIAQSDVTLQLPAAPSQTIVTASVNGGTVTATRLSAVQGTPGPGNGDGDDGGDNNNNNNGGGVGVGVGGLVDAINSVARPSPNNAFDVLSQAEATLPGSNPTANAIINGMGGPAESGGGGGSPQAQEDNLGDGNGNGGQNGGSSGSGSDDAGSRAITVGGAVVTPNAQSEYILGPGQTLAPGGRVVVAGTTYSLDSSASAVVVNGVTQQINPAAEATGGSGSGLGSGSGSGSGPGANIPLITMDNGGAVITPNAATEYSLALGATLTPGGSVVVAGTTYSLDAAGSNIVVNGVTSTLASPAEAAPITIGSATITPNAATAYAVAPGQTLTPGGSVVVSGTTYSLDSSGTALVVDGVTSTLGSADVEITDSSGAASTSAPILTIDGHTFHAINGGSGTTYVIDGQTLTMGEEETVTIDGTAYQISLAPLATRLVVETEDAQGRVTASSTQTLFPEQGAGSGPGASATGSSSGVPEQQVGNVAPSSVVLSMSGVCFALGSLVLAIWL